MIDLNAFHQPVTSGYPPLSYDRFSENYPNLFKEIVKAGVFNREADGKESQEVESGPGPDLARKRDLTLPLYCRSARLRVRVIIASDERPLKSNIPRPRSLPQPAR